jgi:hypothetical protein
MLNVNKIISIMVESFLSGIIARPDLGHTQPATIGGEGGLLAGAEDDRV